MKLNLMLVAGYLLCYVITWGIDFAHFQREYPNIANKSRRQDMGFATALALLSPVSTLMSFLFTGFAEHGLMFPWSKR